MSMDNKIITFSFDDGNFDDIRLIEILNRYGLKGTFNLNSGKLSNADFWRFNNIKDVHHINYCEHSKIYEGHEVACHSYSHPHLENLDGTTLQNEIKLDKMLLSRLFGYEILGMAYPFGTYNDNIKRVLKENNILYSRTTISTLNFDFPEDYLEWHPTCHFLDQNLEILAKEFVDCKSEGKKLFYIWGHSYELVTEEQWQRFERFCEFIANREDISYCTNIEVCKNI